MAVRPSRISPDGSHFEWRSISVCAGVGGLDIGIDLVEPGHRTVCYVEREAGAAASLVASMEGGWFHPAPVWSDLATFDGRPWRGRVHLVTSGDPCQPNSVAGRGLGAADDRFLIDQLVRVVAECRPLRVFRENVTGNADGQLRVLIPALEALGYRVASGIFSAAGVGAAHERERLFVMADADSIGRRAEGDASITPADALQRGDWLPPFAPGPSNPIWSTTIERAPDFVPAHSRYDRFCIALRAEGYAPDGRPISQQRRDAFQSAPEEFRAVRAAVFQATAESHLRGMAHGMADRIERLRETGNGVVSVAAGDAWLSLDARLGGNAAARFAAVMGAGA